MLVYADDRYRLEATGLSDDVSPLVLTAFCQRCEARLHERRYDDVPDGDWAAVIRAQAVADAAAALAHVCLTHHCRARR